MAGLASALTISGNGIVSAVAVTDSEDGYVTVRFSGVGDDDGTELIEDDQEDGISDDMDALELGEDDDGYGQVEYLDEEDEEYDDGGDQWM